MLLEVAARTICSDPFNTRHPRRKETEKIFRNRTWLLCQGTERQDVQGSSFRWNEGPQVGCGL